MQAFRTPSEQSWRDQVALAFSDSGLERESRDWSICGSPDHIRYAKVCSADPTHYAHPHPFHCHNRICPECARKESGRLAAQYVPVAEKLAAWNHPRYGLKHIVLTTDIDPRSPNARERYRETIHKHVPDFFYQVLGRHWQRNERAFLFADDFGEEGHKLHVHCLAFCEYIDQDRMSQAWKAITGCPVVFIRRVRGSVKKAVQEITKYVVKITMAPPKTLVAIYRTIKGSHRIRPYGKFYNIPKPELNHKTECPTCGAALEKWTPDQLYNWLWTLPESATLPNDSLLHLILREKSDKSPPGRDVRRKAIQELNAWIADFNAGKV